VRNEDDRTGSRPSGGMPVLVALKKRTSDFVGSVAMLIQILARVDSFAINVPAARETTFYHLLH